MDLDRFTNAELADMHLLYGLADGDGQAALRMYRERYPTRRVPHYQMFEQLHRNLIEHGSFTGRVQNTGQLRSTRTRTPVMEENVMLHAVDSNPSTSIPAVAAGTGECSLSVRNVIQAAALHPSYMRPLQLLEKEDYSQRLAFAQWYLMQRTDDLLFPSCVLFTGEASFTREDILYPHTEQWWSQETSCTTRSRVLQEHDFVINVWAGIVGDCLVGPYLLPSRLDAQKYLIFLEEVLPDLLKDVPFRIRRKMWFQHDDAIMHCAIPVREYLNQTFKDRWIGRGGPVSWPPHSPDLSSVNFCLWGTFKAIVYETPVACDMDLVARITVAAAEIRETAGFFEEVRQSMERRCQSCIISKGRDFVHLL